MALASDDERPVQGASQPLEREFRKEQYTADKLPAAFWLVPNLIFGALSACVIGVSSERSRMIDSHLLCPAPFRDEYPQNAEENADMAAINAILDDSTPDERAETYKVRP